MAVTVLVTQPELRRLPPSAAGRNPIQDLLDAIGLPWRESRAALAARLGVGRNPITNDEVISFPDAALVPGLLGPLETSAFRSASGEDGWMRLPPIWFEASAWLGADARANIERTAASLAERLGPTTISQAANTLGGGWAAGPAHLRLTVWPPELQGPAASFNLYHSREPRLREACRIDIGSGWRRPLSKTERRWVDGFVEIGALSGGAATEEELRDSPSVGLGLEYLREPPAGCGRLLRKIGHSAGREALILGTERLYVVPATDIVGFHATRMLPARGPGGSWLDVQCRSPGSTGNVISITFTRGPHPDDMNALCTLCGRLFGTPAVLAPYVQNV